MNTKQLETFTVVGVAVRTTNEDHKAMLDIPVLWGRIMTEGVAAKLPSRQSDAIYCVYTEYELDHTRPYTVILGYRVDNDIEIPEGLQQCQIPTGSYAQFLAKGNLKGDALPNAWNSIWQSPINRKYTADFEYYDERAQNPEQGEADIFIALQ